MGRHKICLQTQNRINDVYLYGLIGEKLSHSFSADYFNKKFEREGLADAHYRLFELSTIEQLYELIKSYPQLRGLNVTIPYKKQVINLLHEIDPVAAEIGAVNTIKITPDGMLKGYNTDWLGFKQSLSNFIGQASIKSALILGTGGAAAAVKAALNNLQIPHITVSRRPGKAELSYSQLTPELLMANQLIVNCTPLGMYPDVNTMPDIPIESITPEHLVYDLIYNPPETLLLKLAKARGAIVKNGLEMLYLQAEASWQIWQS